MSFTGQNYDKSRNIPQVSENTQSYTKNLKQVPPKMSMQVSSSGEKFMNITLLYSEFFWKQLLSLNSAYCALNLTAYMWTFSHELECYLDYIVEPFRNYNLEFSVVILCTT